LAISEQQLGFLFCICKKFQSRVWLEDVVIFCIVVLVVGFAKVHEHHPLMDSDTDSASWCIDDVIHLVYH